MTSPSGCSRSPSSGMSASIHTTEAAEHRTVASISRAERQWNQTAAAFSRKARMK